MDRSTLDVRGEEFRRLADEVVAACAEYLDALPERRVFPVSSGAISSQLFDQPCPQEGLGAAAFAALKQVAEQSRALNGRAAAYVLGNGAPVAALGDLFASVINQNVTAWRSSPSAISVERMVVRWLAEAIGCAGFSGTLTGGGSMANLIALACAREAAAPVNRIGGAHGIIYASDEVHMSVLRAASLLGLGRDNVRQLPTDGELRLRVDALAESLREDRARGLTPVAIVASAGTVTTGSVDPLEQIADLARAEGVWLHVDGAYGALAALAEPERFRGLSRADSISLDPHKWLYQPLDLGCVLYRDATRARAAFSDPGEYVKLHTTDPIEGFAFFDESPELSRRFRALKLWLSLRFHGLAAFREAIAADLRHARQLADLVSASGDYELLAPVSLSAVCFRHRGHQDWDEARREEFNFALLRELNSGGRAYLSNGRVRGTFALRACFTNFRTTPDDVEEILAAVAEAGRRVLARESA